MNLLLPIASLLGIEAGEIAGRLRNNAVLWGAIALFAAIALAFGLAGANAALTLYVGEVWAPLIIAAAAAVIAVGIYVSVRIMASVARRRDAQRRRSAETTALVTTAAVTAVPLLLKSPLIRTIGMPLGVALAAWLLTSKSGDSSDNSDESSPS